MEKQRVVVLNNIAHMEQRMKELEKQKIVNNKKENKVNTNIPIIERKQITTNNTPSFASSMLNTFVNSFSGAIVTIARLVK